PEGQIEFFHGYTYSGHPVAAAAALATLDIYAREGLLTRAAELETYWQEALHSLAGHPNVIDIRNTGLVGAVHLASRDNAPGSRGHDVCEPTCWIRLMVRWTADIIALSPPLTLEREQLDRLVDLLGNALRQTAYSLALPALTDKKSR